MIEISGGARRRRDKRWVFVVFGVFIAVFLFSFLARRFHALEDEADAANVAAFDPGYIISDYQMSRYDSMSEAEIQAFLKSKNSCNDTNLSKYTFGAKVDYYSETAPYTWHVDNGHFVCMADEIIKSETAAKIIYQAAQDYRINPQVLIVLLQKEQGLVTDTFPNSIQYRSATGYGCPDTAACDAKYYGFKNQVRKAAELFRTVLDGGWTNYPLGENYVQYNPNRACGGSVVNIRNLATSALYRYTPYQPNAAILAGWNDGCAAYGNLNFYKYFEDWFGGVTDSNKITAPKELVAKMGNNNSITISWKQSEGTRFDNEISYEVVIADSDRKETLVRVGGEAREYTFVDLKQGEYIAASVKAISKYNSIHNRITFDLAIGELPDKPSNLTVEKYNGGIEVSWQEPEYDGGLEIKEYEVVIADTDRKEYKMVVSGEKRSAVFYGLAMKEYFATSVKAINAKGGNHERITFSIKTYGIFPPTEFYNNFLDMPQDEISKTAVSWAVINGITDKNEYFNGETPLSRRQAMVLLWRLAGKPPTEFYNNFLDMPQDEISKTAVSWAVINGITDKNEYFNGE
ncbi:fibronectin type III domain-containing protein, partial [Candidatus Saccharibacteria bacterium]|nr:fibronectin type III domain-containing protein [Candidatus Saccharibacteria bacterium]